MSVSSLDITLLRFLKHKDKHDLYMRGVPLDGLEKTTAIVLTEYGKFFKDNPGATVAMPEDFWPYFKLKYTKMKPEGEALIKAMLQNAGEEVPLDVQDGLAKRLAELRAALEVTSALELYNLGEEVDLVGTLRAITERTQPGVSDLPIVNDAIEDLLKEEEDDRGLHWPLDCLNESMRPLRSGDFGALCARVDTGKTTALVHVATHMAPQLEEYYGERRPVVWLNNEGPGRRIKQRAYQSALNATVQELVQWSNDGSIRQRYLAAMGGWESLVIVDVHDKPLSFLEDVVRRLRPGLVITDMLDVVPYDGTASNGGSRTDQLLEAMYQRGRLWPVLYDTIHIAASQLSAEADGEIYPKLSTMANSRTGKPGACDFVIMQGASQDEAMAGTRWISLPKNKLARAKKDPRCAVQFIPERARLVNPINL